MWLRKGPHFVLVSTKSACSGQLEAWGWGHESVGMSQWANPILRRRFWLVIALILVSGLEPRHGGLARAHELRPSPSHQLETQKPDSTNTGANMKLDQPRSRAIFKDGKFVSPFGSPEKTFGTFLRWQWQRLFTHPKAKWPEWVGSEFEFKGLPKLARGEVDVTFVNHATVLIRFGLGDSAGTPASESGEFRVLTDPIWSHRASPVSLVGPARVRPPGIPWDQLPKIDLVVVSHNHYDHFDLPTLQRLNERDRPQFLVPLGDAELLRESGLQRVREMDWWESEDFEWTTPEASASHSQGKTRLEAQFVPAHHWSARGISDRLRSLWGGFAIKFQVGDAETKVFFAGDTGYSPHFTELREVWGVPDLAILPVGAYEPRWFMQAAHMNPSDAVRAAIDLQAHRVLAIHYRCFQLTDESMEQPEIDLRKALQDQSTSAPRFLDENFWRLKEGETRRVERGSSHRPNKPGKK
jgi:L-ascorbate metabolism protein UlaG (beta-lactamase superfamily)